MALQYAVRKLKNVSPKNVEKMNGEKWSVFSSEWWNTSAWNEWMMFREIDDNFGRLFFYFSEYYLTYYSPLLLLYTPWKHQKT